jgi:ketosteroid isomerase-like protein
MSDGESITERNKEVVRRFYAAMNARDVDAALVMYDDDAKIAVMMDGPFGGEHAPFPEIVFTVGTMTAEDDRVAVEVTSRGRLQDGSPYRNHYHNLFVFRGERIRRFNEYPTGYTAD